MFGYDLPRWHAAVNDLPAALLVAAVLFDLVGWATKRESLVWTGIWTLWAGVIGGWAAVLLGLLAEKKIDHGEAIHALMQTHQTLAIASMIVFTLVLAWKLWRRFQLRQGEDVVLKVVSAVGIVLLVRTGTVGGTLMFDHAAGMPTAKIQAEIENRVGAHIHAPGTMDHVDKPANTAVPRDSTPPPHVDPAGTPPHKH